MFEIDGHFFLAEDILRSKRIRFQELVIRAVKHQFTAEISGAWSYLYNPIGRFDEFLVVFNYDDGIPHLS